MAGQPPTEMTVEKVLSQPGDPWGDDGAKQTYDEVLFSGDSRTLKVYVPTGTELKDGETIKGWRNDAKGSVTMASDNAPQNGGGRRSGATTSGSRDDATGRSIERQVAAKVAGELAAAVGGDGPVVLANFEEFFSAAHKAILGEQDAS